MDSREWPVVAFQGARGSFSDEAVNCIWSMKARSIPTRDFADAVRAVVQENADYAVLPAGNTSIGPIAESLAAIASARDTHVVGEFTLKVRHCLLTQPGAPLAGLRRVLSHPAALAQCSRFLADHPAISPVSAYDTAGAAADVACRGDPAEGAIAPHHAAERYGLSVLVFGIQDDPTNATRFVILASSRADETPAHWRPPQFFTGLLTEQADG